jgi:hypothetical protein
MSRTALGDATAASDTHAKVDTAVISVSADWGRVRPVRGPVAMRSCQVE